MTVHRQRLWPMLFLLVVVECGAASAPALYAPDSFVHADIVTEPDPAQFSVCHGGTCTYVTQAVLDAEAWRRVAEVFAAPAASAQAERGQIGEAIARFETLVGPIAGTADDRAENQTGGDPHGQMDCIDESTNTTTYLRILARAGLLRWHRVEARVTRGYFLFGWPHTTAVVSELKGGERWAVDSWFHANGHAPEIVPLALWRTGWRPGKPPAASFPR